MLRTFYYCSKTNIIKSLERKTGRGKVLIKPVPIPPPAEPETSQNELKNIENEPVEQAEQNEQNLETPEKQTENNNELKQVSVSIISNNNKGYNIETIGNVYSPELKFDSELTKLQKELREKDKEFHKELDRLREYAFNVNNLRDQTERELRTLRDHIHKKAESEYFENYITPSTIIPNSYRKQSFRQPSANYGESPRNYQPLPLGLRSERKKDYERDGMKRYGKMFLTNYNKSAIIDLKQTEYDQSYSPEFTMKTMLGSEEALSGESHMIPWQTNNSVAEHPIEDLSRLNPISRVSNPNKSIMQTTKTIQNEVKRPKSQYEKLDDIMKEFLSDTNIMVEDDLQRGEDIELESEGKKIDLPINNENNNDIFKDVINGVIKEVEIKIEEIENQNIIPVIPSEEILNNEEDLKNDGDNE